MKKLIAGQGDKFGGLYAGKEVCEIIQKIGKIVEI